MKMPQIPCSPAATIDTWDNLGTISHNKKNLGLMVGQNFTVASGMKMHDVRHVVP